MKPVHWTIRARNRLHKIKRDIEEDNPAAALKLVEAILHKADMAGEKEELGKKVPEYDRQDIRQLREQSYRIIYRIKDEQIDVLTVKHVRQRLPKKINRL